MSWLVPKSYSLLHTSGKWPVEWWLVYSDTEATPWWNRWLKPGFRHVQALRRDGSIWLAFKPHAEFLEVEVVRSDATPWQLVPGATIQRVVALRREGVLRSRMFVGPVTCVEHIKALLGIRSWVRTPWQLYRYCRRLNEQARSDGSVVSVYWRIKHGARKVAEVQAGASAQDTRGLT